ncbi:uncharacterized protein LOC124349080 [Daphnia pulicaria]|uniref:uncharacterized protein LOC124349080 n=1 Tax=Daphnia pulicaria TaxID=35523 RepID=UPI001EEBCEDD|nr:uncharacterized protein LOC124349080 [Daphnia pulicaria]XP_046655552.1 uncharacterized protein LOC124349080 [Daphnia pulicaria]
MNPDQKSLSGIFNGVPSYQVLNNQNQEFQSTQNTDLAKLIQHEEKKYWSVKPLFVCAALQIMLGMFLIFGQVILNSEDCTSAIKSEHCVNQYIHVPSTKYAFWCGGIIFFTGLLNGLATQFKTNFLLVVASFLCVVGYGVSLCSLIMSAFFAQIFEDDTQKVVLVGMAVVSGLNFFVFILTSALFCRASCSCCQPRTPTIMYLSPVDDSTQQQNEAFNLPA